MNLTLKWTMLLSLAAFPLCSSFAEDTSVPTVTPPLTPQAPKTSPAPAAPPATVTPAPEPTPAPESNAPVPPPPVPEVTAPVPAPAPAAPLGKPTKQMDEVLKLTKAGIGEDVIAAYVTTSPGFFALNADDILHLKQQGVSSAVVTAMINHDKSLRQQGFNPNGQFPPPGQNIAEPPHIDAGGATNTIKTPPLVPGGPSPDDSVAPDGSQPPPPQTEVVPVAPGPDYYWAPGYWGWNGSWVWVGGIWYPRAWGWGWRTHWAWHGGGTWGWHGAWHGGGFGRGGGGWHGGGGSHGGGGFGRH